MANLSIDLGVLEHKLHQAHRGAVQAELNAEFFRERDRVTALVMAELRKVVDQWIKSNKKGVTVIVPANVALGFAKSADVSAEILKRLNTVTINFTKK